MSWSALAKTLAQLAFSEIGKQIFERFTSQELDAALKDAVSNIISLTKAALEQNDLDQARDLIQSADINFRHYMNSGAEDRLWEATNNIALAIARLDDIDIIDPFGRGLLGHPDFVIAVSLRIAILQERISKYGDSERVELRDHLISSIAIANQMHSTWLEWNKKRFSEVFSLPRHRLAPINDWTYEFYYLFEKNIQFAGAIAVGQNGWTSAMYETQKKKAEEKRQKQINDEWSKIYSNIISASVESVNNWQALLKKIERTISPDKKVASFDIFLRLSKRNLQVPSKITLPPIR